MTRFRYLREPLFILGCALYALNRFWWKPHCHSAFLHSYFNDLLLIPCALPPLLFLHRRLKLRTHDQPPTFLELAGHLLVWSFLFEIVGPHFIHHTTGDLWDIAAYCAGGLVAFFWWQRGALILNSAAKLHEL